MIAIVLAAVFINMLGAFILTENISEESNMTKKQYEKAYPEGEKESIKCYRKALHRIMTSKEIDSLIETTKGRERRWLKKFKNEYQNMATHWADLPVWCTLPVIQSRNLLMDVIVFMFTADELGDEWDESETGNENTAGCAEEDW